MTRLAKARWDAIARSVQYAFECLLQNKTFRTQHLSSELCASFGACGDVYTQRIFDTKQLVSAIHHVNVVNERACKKEEHETKRYRST